MSLLTFRVRVFREILEKRTARHREEKRITKTSRLLPGDGGKRERSSVSAGRSSCILEPVCFNGQMEAKLLLRGGQRLLENTLYEIQM